MAIVWLVVGGWLMWLRLVGRSGRPRGSRRLVMLIFGGWVPQELGSSHVRRLKSSAAAAWRLLRRQIAELLCASRDARAASPAATGMSIRVSASW